MRSESLRQKKVARLLRDALGPILTEEASLPDTAFLSVTRVEVPADLRSARVLISLFGAPDPEAVFDLLRNRVGAVRRRLASAVELKYNPQLVFDPDSSAEEIEKIDRILGAVKNHERETG